ncbi:MAG: hypothetical protein J1F28_06085 [Oscillospiraceae bacterium]|nr:hypothetical protein [Oscillospiraceae bacterium]
MYELLSFSNSVVTRYVKLKNCVTEKVELCFDSSDLHHEGQQDFWFMKVGEKYDCKLLLFGLAFDYDREVLEQRRVRMEHRLASDPNSPLELLICETIDSNIKVGHLEGISVMCDGNVYYVPKKDIKGLKNINRFIFDSSRKDLIQVNEIIAPHYLDFIPK